MWIFFNSLKAEGCCWYAVCLPGTVTWSATKLVTDVTSVLDKWKLYITNYFCIHFSQYFILLLIWFWLRHESLVNNWGVFYTAWWPLTSLLVWVHFYHRPVPTPRSAEHPTKASGFGSPSQPSGSQSVSQPTSASGFGSVSRLTWASGSQCPARWDLAVSL